MWVARQAGLALATPPKIASDGVSTLLEAIIERMAGGNVAAFAKKLGLSKSGVWHWVHKGGLPTLPTWLAMSLHGGIGLEQLYAGELRNWLPPIEPVQLSIPWLTSPRKGIVAREFDWDAIRLELQGFLHAEPPISLTQACQRIGVEHKQLYLRANTEARAIADRYRRHQAAMREDKTKQLHAHVAELVQERLDAGYEGVSARDVWQSLPTELKSVHHSYRQISWALAANDDS